MTTACGWTVGDCPCDLDALLVDPALVEQVQQWAVDMLWRRTGRLYGACPTKIRPCSRRCWGDGWPVYPVRIDGAWHNIGCPRCPGDCSCTAIEETILPGPVGAILEVKVDGVSLGAPETVVRVDDFKRVVRIDGGRWPVCQDLSAPDTDAGTWSITYERGLPLPPGAETVAGILACELAKACAGADGCRLPKRIQTVTRQGMTVGFLDTFDGIDEGFGLFEVDAWLSTLRVEHRYRRPRSPDVPRQRIQTWPVTSP